MVRTCLKNVKDFAFPLEVTFNNKKEIFWKWFLLSDSDAEAIIREILIPSEDVEKPEPQIESESVVEEKIKTKSEPEKIEQQKTLVKQEVKTGPKAKLIPKPKEKFQKKKVIKPRQNFWVKIESFFNENYVEIIEKQDIKRTDFELVISFNTPFGKTKYFCKALQKSKITENDISSAFAKAELKNLPLIFLSNGSPDPAAEKFFELGLIFKRL